VNEIGAADDPDDVLSAYHGEALIRCFSIVRTISPSEASSLTISGSAVMISWTFAHGNEYSS
jgi:hypothetical protein